MIGKRNNFAEFRNKTENQTLEGRFMFYIKNEMLVNKNLQADFTRPSFLSKMLRNRLTGLTIWGDFDRIPERKDKERYFCVIKGEEHFRMVSPVFK